MSGDHDSVPAFFALHGISIRLSHHFLKRILLLHFGSVVRLERFPVERVALWFMPFPNPHIPRCEKGIRISFP